MKMLGLTSYKSSGLGHSEMGGQSAGLCSAGPASADKTTADKGEGIKCVPSYILHPKSILQKKIENQHVFSRGFSTFSETPVAPYTSCKIGKNNLDHNCCSNNIRAPRTLFCLEFQ